MPATLEQTVVADAYLEELTRLFNIYRISNLNMRYYGIRASDYEARSRWIAIGTAILSATALAILLSDVAFLPWAKRAAIASAAAATILTSVAPFLGWTEKARDLRNLHFSYGQVFGQIEFAISEIRRANRLTEEHVGLARMAHEAFMRTEAWDELEPDQRLIDIEDKKVREAFPDNYLWTNF